MTWTPALTELRAALEETFASPDTIGMVLDDAGIPRARITLQAPPAQAWHAALTEAQRLNRVEALIAAARQQYPTNARLSGASDQYLHSMGVATTRSPASVPSEEADDDETYPGGKGATTPGQRKTDYELDIGSVYGGIVTVGSIPGPCFHFRIKNGFVRARIKVMIVRITHIQNQDKRLERSWEGHWRGMPGDFDGTLEPLQESDYALLGVSQFPNGNPTLFIWTKDEPSGGVSYDAPLERQGSLRVNVVINGIPSSVKSQPWTQQFSFTMVPAPGSPNLYEVTEQTS